MCGIYLTNIQYPKDIIKNKLYSIKFRGPDFTGIYFFDNLIFGHLRLSILDLDERSNQPMSFKDLTIVYNGEIYNFKELKHELENLGYNFKTTGDTEVLLKGYDAWGSEMVSKLNGMFSFAIYDKKLQHLFCSRDRIGVKPFYYYWENGKFEICSQLRPICNDKIINKQAVSIYLDCTYIPSPFTIFENVYKLPPGNNLLIDLKTNEINVIEYWNLNVVKESKLTYDEAKSKLHNLIIDAVKIRLQSDVEFGSFLSGGIDSALISSIANTFLDKPIKTFTICFDDPMYDESIIAKKFSKIINSDHTEISLKSSDLLEIISKLVYVYDEPFGDSSAIPSLLLSKVTKQYVSMALSGDGGDESFLGYNHFDKLSKFLKLKKIPYFLRYLLSLLITTKLFGKKAESLNRILKIKNTNDFISGIFIGFNSLLIKRDFSWLGAYQGFKSLSSNSYQKVADLNLKLWLENDSNVKVDRASMAYSVEIRSPFLDYRIIEFARNLPIHYRYEVNKKKKILKDILKEYIPEDVFNQPKKGFSVPIASWMREELREEFIINLSDDFLNQVPNLNVKKFKKMFYDHLEGKSDYSSYIWRVYVLSKWYQEFGFYNIK
jgi:asparagine synthase (glutamine-hydrolysing)